MGYYYIGVDSIGVNSLNEEVILKAAQPYLHNDIDISAIYFAPDTLVDLIEISEFFKGNLSPRATDLERYNIIKSICIKHELFMPNKVEEDESNYKYRCKKFLNFLIEEILSNESPRNIPSLIFYKIIQKQLCNTQSVRLLTLSLYKEIEAHSQNSILVWRYSQKSYDVEKVFDIVPLEENGSVGFLEGKLPYRSLSFSSSLLSGFIGDGYRYSIKGVNEKFVEIDCFSSACTFSYFSSQQFLPKKDYSGSLYALMIKFDTFKDKDFLQHNDMINKYSYRYDNLEVKNEQEGEEVEIFDLSKVAFGVFGKGEFFHPRMTSQGLQSANKCIDIPITEGGSIEELNNILEGAKFFDLNSEIRLGLSETNKKLQSFVKEKHKFILEEQMNVTEQKNQSIEYIMLNNICKDNTYIAILDNKTKDLTYLSAQEFIDYYEAINNLNGPRGKKILEESKYSKDNPEAYKMNQIYPAKNFLKKIMQNNETNFTLDNKIAPNKSPKKTIDSKKARD